MVRLLMVPGLGGSDPEHWQSRWEQGAGSRRFLPTSWDAPDLQDWLIALSRSVQAESPEVLVCHSLGCLTAAHWLTQNPSTSVKAVMLVAPPDPASPQFPSEAGEFADLPLRRLPVPSVVVSSDDDPYCIPPRARELAQEWGAQHQSIGCHGHINTASAMGDWPGGWEILQQLVAQVA